MPLDRTDELKADWSFESCDDSRQVLSSSTVRSFRFGVTESIPETISGLLKTCTVLSQTMKIIEDGSLLVDIKSIFWCQHGSESGAKWPKLKRIIANYMARVLLSTGRRTL